MVVLGVDVGLNRLDAAAMDQGCDLLGVYPRLQLDELVGVCLQLRPSLVAVDAPQRWASRCGRRKAELDLMRLGIRSFLTPGPGHMNRPFYGWMHTGMQVYKALRAIGIRPYNSYLKPPMVVEVFPHASVWFLSGCRPAVRRQLLEGLAVKTDILTNRHLVDAAIAAITAVFVLAGQFKAFGDKRTGFILVPDLARPKVDPGQLQQ